MLPCLVLAQTTVAPRGRGLAIHSPKRLVSQKRLHRHLFLDANTVRTLVTSPHVLLVLVILLLLLIRSRRRQVAGGAVASPVRRHGGEGDRLRRRWTAPHRDVVALKAGGRREARAELVLIDVPNFVANLLVRDRVADEQVRVHLVDIRRVIGVAGRLRVRRVARTKTGRVGSVAMVRATGGHVALRVGHTAKLIAGARTLFVLASTTTCLVRVVWRSCREVQAFGEVQPSIFIARNPKR